MLEENAERLIQQAQLKATGADIHDVNGIIGAYRSAVQLFVRGDCDDEVRFWVWRFTTILGKYVDDNESIKDLSNRYTRERYDKIGQAQKED